MSLLSEEVRGQLIGIYSGPGRHYHDLRHIKALLAMAQEHAREITDSGIEGRKVESVTVLARIADGLGIPRHALLLGDPATPAILAVPAVDDGTDVWTVPRERDQGGDGGAVPAGRARTG